MSKRIVIVKDGFNALTETDPRNKKFDSRYGTLKYLTKVSLQVTIDGGAGDITGRNTYTHNLGYCPFVEVFVRVYIGAPFGNYEYVPFFNSGASVAYNAKYSIGTSSITFYGEFNGVSSSTWTFDFIVFLYKNNITP